MLTLTRPTPKGFHNTVTGGWRSLPPVTGLLPTANDVLQIVATVPGDVSAGEWSYNCELGPFNSGRACVRSNTCMP